MMLVHTPAGCRDTAGSLEATKELTATSMIGGSHSKCFKYLEVLSSVTFLPPVQAQYP